MVHKFFARQFTNAAATCTMYTAAVFLPSLIAIMQSCGRLHFCGCSSQLSSGSICNNASQRVLASPSSSTTWADISALATDQSDCSYPPCSHVINIAYCAPNSPTHHFLSYLLTQSAITHLDCLQRVHCLLLPGLEVCILTNK